MPPRGSFERRLLRVLVLFSLVPSLLLIGVGTYVLSETVALNPSPAAWERVSESGRTLIARAERSGDAALARAAEQHRTELAASLVQSRRWEYLNQRALDVIPLLALVLAVLLTWLAVRAARGMARQLSSPIRELVGWSAQVAREEPLPTHSPDDRAGTEEFRVLRDALRAMASELETSRARALEAERARTWVAMARSVAHELKNPLTPMRFAVRALQRQTGDSPAAREALEVIEAESGRLEELARAFAQFGRLPEGPRSEIDLGEMMADLLRTYLPEGVAHRLRAPVDLPRVYGHHDALVRAFANLLLNIVEATGEETGSVTVQLSAVGDGVEVRLLDDGPGFAPEHLERIWEPDFTTKTRGTGLGLALVRQTVQAHGGVIGARNRPEGGAEIRVRLPTAGSDPIVRDPSPPAGETPDAPNTYKRGKSSRMESRTS